MARKATDKWIKVDDNTYRLATVVPSQFICFLELQEIGVYGMGRAWYLKVRKADETKPEHLDHYWVRADGGYDTYKKENRKLYLFLC